MGLVYFGYRYLSTQLQRWVSADPLQVHSGGADPNLYAYVSGAALKNVDPLGLDDASLPGGAAPPEEASEGVEYYEYVEPNPCAESPCVNSGEPAFNMEEYHNAPEGEVSDFDQDMAAENAETAAKKVWNKVVDATLAGEEPPANAPIEARAYHGAKQELKKALKGELPTCGGEGCSAGKQVGEVVGRDVVLTMEAVGAAKAVQQLAKGKYRVRDLRGGEFEDFLKARYGGYGPFKKNGREFDGGAGNRWFEGKSGSYWEDVTKPGSKGFEKFKSDIGSRNKIAQENGAILEVHTNAPIPAHVRDWLTKKGIPFTEH